MAAKTTAQEFHALLMTNVDAWQQGRKAFEEFTRDAARLWARIRGAGLADEVRAIIRRVEVAP